MKASHLFFCLFLYVCGEFNSFGVPAHNLQPRRLPASWILRSLLRLILPLVAAGPHRISSHLSRSHIDFQSSLNYFGMRSITHVEDLTHFTTSLPLSIPRTHSHRVFCWSYWPTLCLYLFLTSFPFSILDHTHAVCARDGQREGAHVMNNAWCGFLVSETDGGVSELPLRSFSPITYCS